VAGDGVKAVFETNFAIFADLYWVHLAYLDGGVARLRALDVGGEIRAGFTLIDRGGRAHVVAGNRILFRHEQKHAVTPVFAKYHRAIAVATRLGLISVPNRKLRASCAALRRSPAFCATDTSFGPFRARWRWLLASSWEPFVRMHRHERAALHAEVWRVVALVPE